MRVRAFLFLFIFFGNSLFATLTISQNEAERIGYLIWRNECGGRIEHLTWWKEEENFPSFGIGHFIWYAGDQKIHFEQQFPEFLRFAESEHIQIPFWLKGREHCPWSTREEFIHDFECDDLVELRHFLFVNFAVQARFIAQKLERVLPKMVSTLSWHETGKVTRMFYEVLAEKNGIYALADYLNFKGDGCSSKERYGDMGWGLLQVLQHMRDPSNLSPLEEFAFSAKVILLRRVQNAPCMRNEAKWLRGWYKRIDTYLN